MSASHSSTDNTLVERSPFFDVYPVCSQLVSEIGQAFIRCWTTEQADMFRAEWIDKLVNSGISHERAELSWKLVVHQYGKTANAENQFSPSSIHPTTSFSGDPDADRFTELASPSTKGNVFSFEDGRWVVRFSNQTIYPQDITGIKYLHFLISNSGVTFSPTELYSGFGGRQTAKKPNTMIVGDAKSSGVTDQQARQDMLAKLNNAERELAAAKLIPDLDLIEKFTTERIRIQERLHKAFKPAANQPIQVPDGIRRMKAVDIAIRRAKEKIHRAGHHELLQHIVESVEVKVKSGCRYAGSGFSWRTQPIESVAPRKPR